MIWQDFFTSLFGIVVGIILTFGVNHLWRRREEKKRTKDMLILVRNELLCNKEIFNHQEEMLKKDGLIYEKIIEAKNDLASIPIETLKEYHFQAQGLTISQLITSAWQIFQNSEMIQKMTDKEMVIRLTNCYAWMASWHEFIVKDYWEIKKKFLTLELDDPYRFFEAILKNNELYNFIDSFSLDKDDKWASFRGTVAMIDYTIMLLDRHGDYRYDMEEKDNELNSFIEARLFPEQETAQNTTEQ